MRSLVLFIFILVLSGCQKTEITFSGHASETFYVENAGASMRVLVEGNTASKTLIIFVHGGPGAGSFIYNTDYIRENLEDKYAIAYWDQRNAGASQGNCNGDELNLDQMVEDLKKVIQVLKYRYGQDISLFLLGHSFGGLLMTAFATKADYQTLINGLINVNGSHNYPLNETLTRNMLLTVGQQQLALNQNSEEWTDIINYCNSHSGNFTFNESVQLEKYAIDAEGFIPGVKQINIPAQILKYAIKNKYPLTSMLFNYIFSSNADLNKKLAKKEFSSFLYKVTVPVLVLWGKYDFVCPQELGDDFFMKVSSSEKSKIVSPVSGHNIMFQDEKLFCDAIAAFVQKFRH